VETLPDAAHPRAILESQLLSIRARMAAILQQDAPRLRRLVLTGGAHTKPTICQLSPDLFGIPAYVLRIRPKLPLRVAHSSHGTRGGNPMGALGCHLKKCVLVAPKG